jgi:hypothetical protein
VDTDDVIVFEPQIDDGFTVARFKRFIKRLLALFWR